MSEAADCCSESAAGVKGITRYADTYGAVIKPLAMCIKTDSTLGCRQGAV